MPSRFLSSAPIMILGGIGFCSLTFFTAMLGLVIGSFPGQAVLPADCALVFGTAVWPVRDVLGNVVSAAAGPGINRRVSTATDLYRRGLVQKLLLTGGTGQGMRQSEAFVMQRLALDQGVKADDIILEDSAHSTIENLLLARPLAGDCSTAVAVSDRYHLARIAFIARHMGWEIGTVPAKNKATMLFELNSVLREVLILSVLTVQYTLT